jgi:hypothetical protein
MSFWAKSTLCHILQRQLLALIESPLIKFKTVNPLTNVIFEIALESLDGMPDNAVGVPEIPLKTLIPPNTQHCLNVQSGQLLECNERFKGVELRCHQSYSPHHFATSQ